MPLDVPGCTRATMIVAVSISFIILMLTKFKFVAFEIEVLRYFDGLGFIFLFSETTVKPASKVSR